VILSDNYPYLTWAGCHYTGQKLGKLSDRDYPLTWEAKAQASGTTFVVYRRDRNCGTYSCTARFCSSNATTERRSLCEDWRCAPCSHPSGVFGLDAKGLARYQLSSQDLYLPRHPKR
jgi:hypothetical protein